MTYKTSLGNTVEFRKYGWVVKEGSRFTGCDPDERREIWKRWMEYVRRVPVR
jgi:hypothetical protein